MAYGGQAGMRKNEKKQEDGLQAQKGFVHSCSTNGVGTNQRQGKDLGRMPWQQLKPAQPDVILYHVFWLLMQNIMLTNQPTGKKSLAFGKAGAGQKLRVKSTN